MRLLTSATATQGESGGVIAGVYPTPLLLKYFPAKGFSSWGDSSLTEGVLIPSNYNDAASQTNIDDTYEDVQTNFSFETGLLANTQSLKYLAPSFAKFQKAKTFKIAPYGAIRIDSDGILTEGSGGSNDEFKACKIDTNKFLIMWVSLQSGDFRAYIRIADYSTGKIVWGDAQQVTGINLNTDQYEKWDVQQLTTDKFIMIFNDADNSNRVSAVAVSLDGSDLIDVVGLALEIATDTNEDIVCTEFAATDKVVMEWDDSATVISISATGTVLSKGAPVSLLNALNVGSLAVFRYLADDKLISFTGNIGPVASPNSVCQVLTLAGNVITPQATDTRGLGTPVTIINMGTTSATRAHLHILASALYKIISLDISGNVATFNLVDDITLNSNISSQFNRSDAKFYAIDSSLDEVTKYDTDHVHEDLFQSTQLSLPWPVAVTPLEASTRQRDFRDGISLSIEKFGSPSFQAKDNLFSAAMMSPDVDVDIEINGVNVHAAGIASFGLIASIESNQNTSTVEVEIINSSGGLRVFSPDQYVSTVT